MILHARDSVYKLDLKCDLFFNCAVFAQLCYICMWLINNTVSTPETVWNLYTLQYFDVVLLHTIIHLNKCVVSITHNKLMCLRIVLV